jgi:4-amino-4-deoxy-L-arabinose transferase-like glycosyltransferase
MLYRNPYLAVTLLCGVLFFGMLGSSSLWDIDETSNATAAKEMLQSGDYVVPTLDGELRTDKPPFHYWCMTLAYRVFGVGEFGARFFAGVFGVLTVLMVIAAGTRVLGPPAGTLAGLILAVSFLFVVSSRSATTDAFLVFFANSAVLAGFFARNSRLMVILCWAAMGMAVLAKGPVGIVLPAAALGLYYMVRERNVFGWRPLASPWGIILFTAIAVPWYLLAASRTGGDLISGFILKHNVGRFVSTMESHRGPFFYYLLVLLPGLYPWAAFLPQAFKSAWQGRGGGNDRDDFRLLLLIWAGLEIVFFSIARTKLPTYILPAFPALALLLASWVYRSEEEPPASARGLTASWSAAALTGLIWPVLFIVLFKIRMPDLLPWAWLTLPLAAAPVAGLVLHLRKMELARVFVTVGIVTAVGVACVQMFLVPALEPYRMAPAVGRRIAAVSKPGEKAAQWGYFVPSLVFYSGLHLDRLNGAARVEEYFSREGGRFLVTTRGRYEELPTDLKAGFSVRVEGLDAADSNEVVMLLEWNKGQPQ